MIVSTKRNAFGMGAFNRRAMNQPLVVNELVLPEGTNQSASAVVKIWNRNEHLLDAYYPTIQNSIIANIEYEYDEAGSGACEINFLERSKIGFASFGIVTIDKGTRRYKGFIHEFPDDGSNKNEVFIYKIKGLRERLKQMTIKVSEKYDIQSISQSGTSSTFTISETLSYNPIGRMLVSANSANKFNNTNSIITSYTFHTVTIYNPLGINQATPQGEFRILPYEWSVSTKISDIFKQVILEYASRYNNGITYNSLKIDDSVGYTSQGWIDLDTLTLDKVFDGLRKMLNGAYILGVDEDGDFFFKQLEDDPLDYLYIGYHVQDAEIKAKPGDIFNRITVFRKNGKQKEGTGLSVGAIGGPLEDANISAAKFGDRYKEINMPSFFSDEANQLVADNALSRYKDLKYTVKINNIPNDKKYKIGIYQVVTPPVDRKLIISEHDSITGWTIQSGITTSISESVLVSGVASTVYGLRTASNNKTATYNCNMYLASQAKINLWVRCTHIGQYMDISISDGINTYTNQIFFDTKNTFALFTWDISDLPITKITQVKYTFKNSTGTNPHAPRESIFVDELSVELFGSIRYNVPLQKVKVKELENYTDVDLQFGEEFDKLSDYLLGLQALSENSILAHRS